MQKIKAILCDYDGTLVDGENNYPQEIKTLIKKIQSKNVRLSMATGRPYYGPIKKVDRELNIKGIHILQNGAMIFDSANNKILLQHTISQESGKKIIDYLLSQNLIFSLEAEENVYISRILKENVYYPEIPNKTINELNVNTKILKMVIYARANQLSESKIDFFIENLQKLCKDIYVNKFYYRDIFGADITSEKATKHTGVLEYLKLLNLSPDEVVAIGDGYNDYPLFTACGFRIAMANAPKELKEISNLIVPSVNDGGMIEALDYIYNNLM